MADAPPDWKFEWIKMIRDMPHGSTFAKGITPKQDLIWIHDLDRDGYISAEFRMGYFEDGDKFADSSIPNLIWDVHVLDKGRDLIAEFESPKQSQKDSGEHWYKQPVGIIFLSVTSALVVLLIKHFFGF